MLFLFMWAADAIINKVFGEYDNIWLKGSLFLILAFLFNWFLFFVTKKVLKKEKKWK